MFYWKEKENEHEYLMDHSARIMIHICTVNDMSKRDLLQTVPCTVVSDYM